MRLAHFAMDPGKCLKYVTAANSDDSRIIAVLEQTLPIQAFPLAYPENLDI